MSKGPSPKEEARQALLALAARLADGIPLLGLERTQYAATARYALEQVEQIAELKRARPVKKALTS